MKVLYFHQHFSTPSGSGGIRSFEMARALLERGHRVTMVCGSHGQGNTGLTGAFCRGVRRGSVAGIDVVEFELPYSNRDGFLKRTLTFLKFAWRSTWFALTERHDIIFATSTPLTASIPGIAARWLRGSRFVFEVRDLWPELPREMGVIRNPVVLWAMSVLEWVSYHAAHRLVGLSPGIVKGILRRGIPSERVTMVPNGCDLALFADVTQPWRPEGVTESDLMAVFAGSHGKANGLDAALSAAAELRRRGRNDIKIVLIGDGMLKPSLKQRAQQEQLTNVVFCDPVNKSRVADLMASTDLGLQLLANVPAFYYGTSPNKFFDYISARVPPLINYPGWLVDVVQEYNCGIAITPDDPKAFADALESAAADRAELKHMGERAFALASAKFSRVALAAQWVDWIELAAGYDPPFTAKAFRWAHSWILKIVKTSRHEVSKRLQYD
jgi:glycosyltransferase involved in cell wall biosynthesis